MNDNNLNNGVNPIPVETEEPTTKNKKTNPVIVILLILVFIVFKVIYIIKSSQNGKKISEDNL